MPEYFTFSEGHTVDDAGHVISTTYVDMRDPAQRRPITTLVKGCPERYAIELCKTVRISKPQQFRKYGEGLIRDPAEGHFSHVKLDAERIDDPDDLTRAQALNDELNRASELSGSPIKMSRNTRSTRTTHTSTHSLSYGKNGWLFCSSLIPSSKEEEDAWRESMPEDYDHTSHIRRPRAFARALAAMVAEQLGSRGSENKLTYTLGGDYKIESWHKTQTVFHGPVTYVENPYEVVSNAGSQLELILLPIFVKGMKYRDQQEYRFAVFTEDEPSEEIADLNATLSLLGAMQEPLEEPGHLFLPPAPPAEAPADSAPDPTAPEYGPATGEEEVEASLAPDVRSHTSLLELVNDPSTPVSLYPYSPDHPPHDLYELTTAYSAVAALRQAVENLPQGRRAEAASSAWHAEPCVRRLCSEFEDPIQHIRISDDNYVVIKMKFPYESHAEGRIVVGPLGAGTLAVDEGQRHSLSPSGEARLLHLRFGERLEEAGLRRRPRPPASASENLTEGG